MRWLHTVGIKHLLAEDEEYESVKNTMNKIADILSKEKSFQDFASTIQKFRDIPEDEDFLECANDLLDELYDYADEHRIWIA